MKDERGRSQEGLIYLVCVMDTQKGELRGEVMNTSLFLEPKQSK